MISNQHPRSELLHGHQQTKSNQLPRLDPLFVVVAVVAVSRVAACIAQSFV